MKKEHSKKKQQQSRERQHCSIHCSIAAVLVVCWEKQPNTTNTRGKAAEASALENKRKMKWQKK